MNIKWPPEKTITYEAKSPTREDSIVINAMPGGNPNKARKSADKANAAER